MAGSRLSEFCSPQGQSHQTDCPTQLPNNIAYKQLHRVKNNKKSARPLPTLPHTVSLLPLQTGQGTFLNPLPIARIHPQKHIPEFNLAQPVGSVLEWQHYYLLVDLII